ncbi:zinc-binding dehydrogenase [Pseudomonas meliae]|uniref:zinc-binding dehydrogenase n=1 Tax=Pseudomonas meliae TaxID=86176 RepID=UPI0038B49AB9
MGLVCAETTAGQCGELQAAEGKLKPLVSTVYPLEKAGEAIDLLGERRAVGNVVVLVN